ncbi:GntR family transcriptional regulator [Clostridioides difficile]|uniref:MocR-like pyridoxine biosynthesis transcription factor PdxR n=1 Tax=Clostridioides difficile TaxID=1496 RepID=UPI0003B29FE9|nr:PLP-dependent aminotransferase family protein [Clostridioides difficile]MCE0688142.1 PLP-dependent aminotransferase family protein [Clostridioides difficile]MCE0712678.1 PLP-dependent aminotransferase family protein [Clostridioides difficile]MCE0720034.1 PLP-dependent aminotransferase family protein [Clostridioides difficile]MCE0729527.1 PLP-dependent aminotransferase family protein [Clostridioides difficile]QPL01704.1 GntR family transcriptional regulator [Clostridioides difficile]
MWITINRNSNISLSRQIYCEIKDMILNGSLKFEQKLPSSRTLSKELSVSRNTVLDAYNQLIAEGYLETRNGYGTIVAKGISGHKVDFKLNYIFRDEKDLHTNKQKNYIYFRSGVPELKLFPRKELSKLYKQILYDLSDSDFRYGSTAGVWVLRAEISKYLFRTRGIRCNPKNIMIVSGSTQGLSLISQLLYKSNKKVAVEDPIHKGLLKVISSIGYSVVGVKVDDKGINTNLIKSIKGISFVYTTPSHQYPLGGILPIQRRLELIKYATENGYYIIEDDYDSEFRYEGQPISSLYELNPNKVIYIGSFSKILSPAIRVGFILLPDNILESYKTLKMYSDVHTETILQHVLAEFIGNGGLEKYIFRMKKLYNRKRKYLIKVLNTEFKNEFKIKGEAAGLHIVAHFYNVKFTESLIHKIFEAGIKVYPIQQYAIEKILEYDHEIILGYAHLSFDEIEKGVKILSKIIHINQGT